MKRAIVILLLIVILLISLHISYQYTFKPIPDMSKPSTNIAVDSEGRFYMFTNTDTEFNFMRVDSSNIIDYFYTTEFISADSMQLFDGLFIDEYNGGFYSIKNILDNESGFFVSSNIVHFDPNTKYSKPKILYSFVFDLDNPYNNQYIDYIYPQEDALYFTTIDENLRNVVLYNMDIKTMLSGGQASPEEVLSFSLEGNAIINKTLCGKDYVIVQTMDAKIYHIDSNGFQTQLFPTRGYEGRHFPLSLNLTNENKLYFHEVYTHNTIEMDIKTGRITYISEANSPIYPGSTYLQSDIVQIYVHDKNIRSYLVQNKTGKDSSVFPLVLYKGEMRSLANLEFSRQIILSSVMQILLIVLFVFVAIFILYRLVRYLFYRRRTLLTKLVTFVFPVIIVAMFAFSQIATRIFNDSITRERTALVKNVGSFVVQNIDIDLLSQINEPGDMLTYAHAQLLKSITNAIYYSPFYSSDIDDKRLYCVLMKVEEDQIYTAVSADMPCFVPLDSLYSKDSMDLYYTALNQKDVVIGTIHDVQGIWTVSIFPVFDDTGRIVGMLESGINSKDLEASMLMLSRFMLLAGLIASIAVFAALFAAIKFILDPLKLLKDAVISVYNGNYGAQAVIKTTDEVSDISRAFNQLSLNLREQFDKLNSLNQAYFKFVPPDTFSLLRKESILDVKLGDQESIKMTIMNARINNFEMLTSDLPQEDIFKFINRIFKIISTNTAACSGTIHSYNVDRVTTLFQGSSEDALQAVINIRSDLATDSSTWLSGRFLKTDAGFYIHTASCIYGIVGEENRYSPVVVSENNDLLYALENIQQALICPILVTQSAYDEIADPYSYNHRYIGFITDSNTQEQIRLYEFFDGDEQTILAGKKKTLKIFELAISAYINRDFYRARNLFAQILKENSKDTIARWFLFKCDELCKYADEASASVELSITKF